jgi:hypothetical protein
MEHWSSGVLEYWGKTGDNTEEKAITKTRRYESTKEEGVI